MIHTLYKTPLFLKKILKKMQDMLHWNGYVYIHMTERKLFHNKIKKINSSRMAVLVRLSVVWF